VTFARQYSIGYLQDEPDAGKPHVRICEGKSRMAELLDRGSGPSAAPRPFFPVPSVFTLGTSFEGDGKAWRAKKSVWGG
jgi:hypothetical protein